MYKTRSTKQREGGSLSLLFTNYIHHHIISYHIIAAKHTQLMGMRGELDRGTVLHFIQSILLFIIFILLTNSAAAAASR